MSVYAILYDQTLCIGCKACEQACQSEHDQPPHTATRLDEQSFNWVEELGNGLHQRHFCMSCEDPTCVSVCPVGAFTKSSLGPVTWDPKLCMGCRYCMMACPFGVPRYEWSSVNPRVRKCDMCIHRVSKGRPTACAEVCPTGATLFGRRDEMLAEAHRRLREHPDRYTGGVYGEREVGGTDVLMLLASGPEASHLPANLPLTDKPLLTWNVLNKLPVIIAPWATFLGGMMWLTDRKNEVARHDGDRRERGDEHE